MVPVGTDRPRLNKEACSHAVKGGEMLEDVEVYMYTHLHTHTHTSVLSIQCVCVAPLLAINLLIVVSYNYFVEFSGQPIMMINMNV